MTRSLTRLLLLLLTLALLPQAALADVAGGKRALAKKDYRTALKEFEVAAKTDPEAMFLFGNMIAEGQGTARDDKRAFEWIEKSAVAGHVPAQGALARFYAAGRGTARDNDKSIEWARRAAENGDALSQYMMGLRSAEGWGVPRDLQAAVVWFGSAAEQGYGLAQYSIGMLSGFGPAAAQGEPGSKRNRIEGAKWLALAARQQIPELKGDAEKRLAELRAKMSDDEIREATERVRKWAPVVQAPKP